MTVPKKFLFVDLDDTLFQSRRKCPDGVPLAPAAYLKDGTAHSFLTPLQHGVLGFLQREMVVIPVTARSVDAYARVRLGFVDRAVVNYGGVILHSDGTPDVAWLERNRNLARTDASCLETIRDTIIDWVASAGTAIRVRIIADLSVPFYVCAKCEEGNEASLDRIEAMARARWPAGSESVRVHRNGSNLSVLPGWLDKRHAVAHLIQQLRHAHGEIATFGMGDSLSDVGFMTECDYALIPRDSQISRRLAPS